MKKYFPIFLFILTFTAILSGQIFTDLFSISATLSDREKNLNMHLESTFNKSVFKTLKNEEVSLKKVESPLVILNFWGSWCQPCLMELPGLVELRKKFKNNELEIFAVNADEEDQMKMIQKTVDRYNLNFNIVPDKNSRILNDYLVSSIPFSIIFNRGKIYKVISGTTDFQAEELVLNLKSLLKEN